VERFGCAVKAYIGSDLGLVAQLFKSFEVAALVIESSGLEIFDE